VTAPAIEGPLAANGIESGSFRDRSARVFYSDGSVFRGLSASAWQEWQSVVITSFFKQALDTGRVVATEIVDPTTLRGMDLPFESAAVLRHQAIPFVTYPYEWCFGMLKHAALLQLEMLEAALAEDFTLKDATPFNIQWIGPRPVFIDVASFVRLRPGQPWTGYRQFCRMFLYPLFLHAYKGVPFHPWLRGRLEGIDADECRRIMSWRDMLRPGVLSHVVAQSRFERRYADTARDIRQELRRAGFDKRLISANLAGLRRLITGLKWVPRASAWSDYVCRNSYDYSETAEKDRFVEAALGLTRPRILWDLGCNTGRFSKLAAKYADYVVAIDSDHESIERLYGELRCGTIRNVIPLVMDVSDPSPGLGWRGTERRPLLQRGRPELVLCLAVIHHLAITSNVPIADLVEWFAEMGAALVVEFPTPDDPMVKRLLLNKDSVYNDYSVTYFERALGNRFDIRDRLVLASGTRILYYAVPKRDTARAS
jgi:SAM-dependent methyltransferase